jgi:hypothetical protein
MEPITRTVVITIQPGDDPDEALADVLDVAVNSGDIADWSYATVDDGPGPEYVERFNAYLASLKEADHE